MTRTCTCRLRQAFWGSGTGWKRPRREGLHDAQRISQERARMNSDRRIENRKRQPIRTRQKGREEGKLCMMAAYHRGQHLLTMKEEGEERKRVRHSRGYGEKHSMMKYDRNRRQKDD